MRVFGKSKLNDDIYDKIKKGANAIEIHLDEEFTSDCDFWDETIVNNVPIGAVHAPMTRTSNTNIEIIASRDVLVKTCAFAQRIATYQRHPVIVVCHLATSPQLLQQLGVYESLVFFMRDLIEMFPDIEIAIENVIHFTGNNSNLIGFQDADFRGSVQLAKDIAHERVGTCLDTCHAMVDIGLINYITGYLRKTGELSNDEVTKGMEAFFEYNKPTIKLIHLSNAQSHGMYEDHGMPFTKSDDEKLKSILALYRKYDYACPITLEVRELDYSNARYFQITLNSLQRILNDII